MTGFTMTEKILGARAGGAPVRAGTIATVKPDVVLLNDVSGPLAFDQFRAMGATRPAEPDGVVLVADHFAPAKDVLAAEAIGTMRRFAGEHAIKHFYEPGRGGIEHTLLVELGLVGHGSVVFGGDSHTCTAGAFNAIGMGFGSTDLAAAMAAGKLWIRIPESIKVFVTGRPGPFVAGKDVILDVIRRIGSDGAADAALEFVGPGLDWLSTDARMAAANMAVEAGADTCVFAGDGLSEAGTAANGAPLRPPIQADADAAYRSIIEIDLAALSPIVACPPSPASGVPVETLRGRHIDQVYVGNCSNGTLTDLRQVAEVLRGRRIAPHVRMIVVPATQKIWRQALAEGLLDVIAEAGAAVSVPTCGACFGGHMGVLGAGETAIATVNRNFRGRMGHPDSLVYLSNAWVAAAAAVAGKVVPPQEIVGDMQ